MCRECCRTAGGSDPATGRTADAIPLMADPISPGRPASDSTPCAKYRPDRMRPAEPRKPGRGSSINFDIKILAVSIKPPCAGSGMLSRLADRLAELPDQSRPARRTAQIACGQQES